MNKRYIGLIVFCLLTLITAYTQCNQHLVEIAAEQAGANAIYIRDFKVKLSKGDMKNPTPTGKFPVYLNKGVNYRFTVANASEYNGLAYVELMRRGQKYADNYLSTEEGYSTTFDFSCERSASYQLMLNFGAGSEGCAAVVMSLIFQDSMAYIEPGIAVKSDSAQTLYLWTNNKLQIASSEQGNSALKVSVSQGDIEKRGQFYELTPSKIGDLTVRVDVFKDGNYLESDSVLYCVEYPPLPRIILPGMGGYSLSKREVNSFDPIELEYQLGIENSPYELEKFYISTDQTGINAEPCINNILSSAQVGLIKELKTDDRLYIINAVFVDCEGKLHRSKAEELLIME